MLKMILICQIFMSLEKFSYLGGIVVLGGKDFPGPLPR